MVGGKEEGKREEMKRGKNGEEEEQQKLGRGDGGRRSSGRGESSSNYLSLGHLGGALDFRGRVTPASGHYDQFCIVHGRYSPVHTWNGSQ